MEKGAGIGWKGCRLCFVSGTRKEERILPPETLKQVTLLRRSLVSLKPIEAMESLVKKLGDYPSNAAFLE